MWMLWKRGGSKLCALYIFKMVRCHKPCSVLRNLREMENFVCPSFAREGDGGDDDGGDEVSGLILN